MNRKMRVLISNDLRGLTPHPCLLSMNLNLSVAVWENKRRHNPVGVDEIVCESTQGSLARSATPGFGAQSLWDWTNKSAREKHSIWFMVGEQVRMEQATLHEPRKMVERPPLTLALSPPRGEGTRWAAMLDVSIRFMGSMRELRFGEIFP